MIEGPNLFRHRSFIAMWVVSLANGLGEKMFFVFLVLLVTQSSNSNSLMSALSVAFAIPAVLFGSVAGVFVDRFPLKTLLVISNASRALFVLALPLAGDLTWPLMGFAFGFAFLTQFFNPTFMATVPTVVHRNSLMAANAVFMATMITTVIAGFALAEPISTLVGLDRAHLTVVGVYALAALASALIQIPAQPEKPERTVFWREWQSAFGYLRARPGLVKGYLMAMSMFGTFAALNVLVIGFAKETLKVPNFGVLLAMAGAGMAIGAGIVGRWGRRLPKAVWVRGGFVLVGVGLLALSFTRTQPAAMAFATLVGVAGAFIEIPFSTLIQESVDEEMRGKIFGLQGTLMYIASTLPMAVVGPLADIWGSAQIVAALGVAMGAMALFRLPERAAIEAPPSVAKA